MFLFLEKAEDLKNEGNSYFKEKRYEKATVSYSAALTMKSSDQDLNAVIFSNRAAAHFHLGKVHSHFYIFKIGIMFFFFIINNFEFMFFFFPRQYAVCTKRQYSS